MAIVLSLTVACASSAGYTEINADDRLGERLNKHSYNATDWVDQYSLKPLAQGYRFLLPDPLERAVARIFANVREVRTAVNRALQGKLDQAAHDSRRVLANSTLGVLGLFEVAEPLGLEKGYPEDFGQTLAAWGIGSGGYVYLPMLGPSTVRDAPARVVDALLNPINYLETSSTRHSLTALDFVQRRAALFDNERLISGDRYQFIKDAYLQRRDYLIRDGVLPEDDLDDFDSDF
ncbi:MAG: VacJ family lipoprotein [Cellvibrionales bacterium]|nr:VacJ family lipoprotein [Cellvibrionales bacterium]